MRKYLHAVLKKATGNGEGNLATGTPSIEGTQGKTV